MYLNGFPQITQCSLASFMFLMILELTFQLEGQTKQLEINLQEIAYCK